MMNGRPFVQGWYFLRAAHRGMLRVIQKE